MRIIYYISNLFFILLLQKSQGEYSCNSDWKLVGDTCIGVFIKTDEKSTWHMARNKCHKLNSTLVTVRSPIKQTLITPLFSGDAWIDLFRDSSSNDFLWANGDPTVDYQSWQTGQPNNGGEGCAVILSGYSRGYWADKPCFNKYYYICEKASGTSGCGSPMVPLAGKCYSFHNDTKKWFEAREECQKIGGDLLVIENALKNDIIRAKMYENSLFRYRTFWIGATDVKEEGKWRWLDQNQVMTYQNWSSGSPDNGGNGIHSCVYMPSTYRNNGAWKTADCNVYYPFCCERRPIFNNGSTTCEDDWKLYNNESCIVVHPNMTTWASARQKCKQMGGDLVVVKDSTKSTFVRRRVVNVLRGRTAWIGLRDLNLKGEWNWLDSTEKTTFLDWYTGYPRESLMRNIDCVFMRSTMRNKGRWANTLCTLTIAYICEMVASGQCDAGWHSFGGHCYKLNYDISSYDQASGRCKLQNSKSDLVVIDNYAEQRWLQDKIDSSSDVDGLWIGLNSKQQKNFFVWLNGTTPASYTNWDAGMPSYLKSEACVSATGTYRKAEWKDEDCMEKNGYLCEKLADGDASYYDFRYNSSVYKVLMSQFTPEHGNEYCKKILGINSSLILFETEDELNYIMRELDARGQAKSKRYWTKGNLENTPTTLYTTPRPSSQTGPPDYASRTCLELWFEAYGPWQSRKYRPKLRPKACCGETSIICEKHINPKLTMDNKYDFALNSSIYRLVDEEMLDHDSAHSNCADLLDNTGGLAEFETWDELEAVSREVLARHIGEHFIYWVGGDPLDENSTSVDPKVDSDGGSHCMIIEYEPSKLKTTFDPTMTLKSTECTGAKKFLCEQKGIQTNVDDVSGSFKDHMEKYASDSDYRAQFLSGSGCVGPCIGLAVALPFVAIGAVLITVAYFWLIRRQSPFAFKFNHADDEVRLTM